MKLKKYSRSLIYPKKISNLSGFSRKKNRKFNNLNKKIKKKYSKRSKYSKAALI